MIYKTQRYAPRKTSSPSAKIFSSFVAITCRRIGAIFIELSALMCVFYEFCEFCAGFFVLE